MSFKNKHKKISDSVRKELNIKNERLLLYAPTFREKYIENKEFLDKVIKDLPKENNNIVFIEYEFCEVIRKTKKYRDKSKYK